MFDCVQIAVGVQIIASDKFLLLFQFLNHKIIIPKVFTSSNEAVLVGKQTIKDFIHHCIENKILPDQTVGGFVDEDFNG